MPYKLRQKKGQWCVEHLTSGEHFGCHGDKKKAISELRVRNQAYKKERK